jgi:hypothetical protein
MTRCVPRAAVRARQKVWPSTRTWLTPAGVEVFGFEETGLLDVSSSRLLDSSLAIGSLQSENTNICSILF